MNRRFIIIMVVIFGVFLGLLLLNKKDAPESADTTNSSGSQHVKNESASVRLVEYGDFQCPACAAYYPLVKQIEAHYGDKLGFQFINFPIVGSHPNAMSAHRAAEAAHKQGKFWEMHDLLFERQSAWTGSRSAASVFEGFAEELGLDMDRYREDLASSEIQAIINADLKIGQAIKVSATPSFVLDGKKIEETPRDLEGFTKLIDEAITAKQQ